MTAICAPTLTSAQLGTAGIKMDDNFAILPCPPQTRALKIITVAQLMVSGL